MKNWKDISIAIALVAATVGAVTYFTPIRVFNAQCVEFQQEIDTLETRLDGIDTAYLKKRLDELAAKYGHYNCYAMTEPDKGECIWLKDALARFGG